MQQSHKGVFFYHKCIAQIKTIFNRIFITLLDPIHNSTYHTVSMISRTRNSTDTINDIVEEFDKCDALIVRLSLMSKHCAYWLSDTQLKTLSPDKNNVNVGIFIAHEALSLMVRCFENRLDRVVLFFETYVSDQFSFDCVIVCFIRLYKLWEVEGFLDSHTGLFKSFTFDYKQINTVSVTYIATEMATASPCRWNYDALVKNLFQLVLVKEKIDD